MPFGKSVSNPRSALRYSKNAESAKMEYPEVYPCVSGNALAAKKEGDPRTTAKRRDTFWRCPRTTGSRTVKMALGQNYSIPSDCPEDDLKPPWRKMRIP